MIVQHVEEKSKLWNVSERDTHILPERQRDMVLGVSLQEAFENYL